MPLSEIARAFDKSSGFMRVLGNAACGAWIAAVVLWNVAVVTLVR